MKKNRIKIIIVNILISLILLFSASFVKAAEDYPQLILNGVWQDAYTLAVNYAKGNIDGVGRIDCGS